MRALVWGASGQVGRAVALNLAQAGWQVRAVARGGRPLAPELRAAGVQPEPPAGTRAALIRRLGVVDAVVDPLAFTVEDAEDLLTEQSRVGAFAVISTASVYADDQGRGFETDPALGPPHYPDPIRETQALVAPGQGYCASKVALEQALAQATRPVTILRPAAIHGIGARHPREFWFLKRALDGRTRLPLAMAGQTWFQTTSTLGLAGFTTHALTRGLTGAFNIGDPTAPSAAEVAQAVAGHIGHRFTILDPGPKADPVGHSPLSPAHPIRLSMAKARATGWDGGPDYVATLSAYLTWMIPQAGNWRAAFPVFARYGHDPFDYPAEDRALDLLPTAP